MDAGIQHSRLTMQAELGLFNQKAILLLASLAGNSCFRRSGVTLSSQLETV
jgi:hypothetical protein